MLKAEHEKELDLLRNSESSLNELPKSKLIFTSRMPESIGFKPIPPKQEKIIVDVSPAYLFGFFKEHTVAQANKLIEAYLDKWIKVSGVVADVVNHNDYSEVYLKKFAEQGRHIFASFYEPKWIDRIQVLKREDKVTILGQILQINQAIIFLHYCELSEEKLIEVPAQSEEKTSVLKQEKRQFIIERLKEFIKEGEEIELEPYIAITLENSSKITRRKTFRPRVESFLKDYFDDSYIERFNKKKVRALEDFLKELLG